MPFATLFWMSKTQLYCFADAGVSWRPELISKTTELMKPLKTFTAVVFLVTFVFIFFSTLHLERTRRAKSDVLWYRSPTVDKGEVKASTQVRATTPNTQRLSVYNRFRQTIPQNGAYWNRPLYTAIKQLENAHGVPPGQLFSGWPWPVVLWIPVLWRPAAVGHT